MDSHQSSVTSEQLSVASQQSLVASEEELEKLKEVNEKQAAEERLRKEVEGLKTPSPLRGTPPLQGESYLNPKLEASATLKTQGLRPSRTDGMGALHSAAKRAAQTNSRGDVQAYMRLRRGYV